MDPEALALGGDVSPWGEGVVQELEIRFLEEGLGGSDGVGGVGDDDVVGGFVICEEFEAVANVDGYFWGGEEGGHVWEVHFGYADDGLDGRYVCVVG